MIYIYTVENCGNCSKLKLEYYRNGTKYEERNAERIKSPHDEIDQEALILASMQNMTLPVIVEI